MTSSETSIPKIGIGFSSKLVPFNWNAIAVNVNPVESPKHVPCINAYKNDKSDKLA